MAPKKITHKQIQYYIALRKESSSRNAFKKIVLTDTKTCFESPENLEQLIVNEEFTGITPPHSLKTLATSTQMTKISGMHQHPPFIGVTKKPKLEPNASPKNIIFLDHIQDPGNVGTIIRSALAFNFDALYYSPNSCDPFNDKALRAAKSAIFHLPICKITPSAFIEKFHDFNFYQADIQGQSLNSVALTQKNVLIFSNEGSGPTNLLNINKTRVTIPINPNVESLNVSSAANIFMYHFSHQSQQLSPS